MASTSVAGRPNWILLENKQSGSGAAYVWGGRSSTAAAVAPVQPRIDRTSSGRVHYHQPLLVPSTSRALPSNTRDAQAKIHSINRLNDRIQRRIATSYAGLAEERGGWPTFVNAIPEEEILASEDTRSADTAAEGRRVVDESFGFIHDEGTVGTAHGHQLYTPNGQIDRPSQSFLPRLSSKAARRRARIQAVDEEVYEARPAVLNRHSTKRDSTEARRIVIEPESKTWDRNVRRRSDSLDSTNGRRRSLREVGRRWSIASGSVQMREQYAEFLPPSPIIDKKPSLLKRDSKFYQRCDLCSGRGRNLNRICPACGRTPADYRNAYYASPTRDVVQRQRSRYRSPATRPLPEEPREQILSAHTLRRNPAFYRPPPPLPPLPPQPIHSMSRRTSDTIFATGMYRPPSHSPPRPHWGYEPAPWAAAPVHVSTLPRRTPPSPVFRYGKRRLPEALYDYEVYAAEKKRVRRRRRAAAFTFALIALCLIVAAGVVLAAVNY